MLYTREQLEQFEDQFLAPYGMRSKLSKGRAYPDKEPQYRTAFQRDRDRILHTTAFRRLEYKTQVFINYEGDYFRTRLTHTLEVAQIGRTIAKALGANEELVEAICLAHDLGHPPFGHSGEEALNRLMEAHGGFDHNKQSYRIVTKLESRYPEWPGLNLTWEVREGIVKHETEYDVSDAQAYDPELRGNLEAQIANIADELAYTSHDLDDGLRSGLITPAMLSSIELWQQLADSVGWSGPELTQLDRHRLIRRLVGMLVADVLEHTHTLINEAGADSVAALQKLDHSVVGYSPAMKPRNRELKSFLFNELYSHYRVIRMAVKADSVLSDLYNKYLEVPRILPPEVLANAEQRGLERAACDYLAGMTDRFAIDEYQRLFDPLKLP